MAASSVLVLGLVMMVGMIVVEDEPGGIPVLLVVLGGAWLVRTHRQVQKHTSQLGWRRPEKTEGAPGVQPVTIRLCSGA